MRTVVAPLNPGNQGPAVVDLQAALSRSSTEGVSRSLIQSARRSTQD